MSRLGVGSAGAVRISADSVKRPSGAQVSLSSLVDTMRLGSGGSKVSAPRLDSAGGGGAGDAASAAAASALKTGVSGGVEGIQSGALNEQETPALFCLQLDDDLTEIKPMRFVQRERTYKKNYQQFEMLEYQKYRVSQKTCLCPQKKVRFAP